MAANTRLRVASQREREEGSEFDLRGMAGAINSDLCLLPIVVFSGVNLADVIKASAIGVSSFDKNGRLYVYPKKNTVENFKTNAIYLFNTLLFLKKHSNFKANFTIANLYAVALRSGIEDRTLDALANHASRDIPNSDSFIHIDASYSIYLRQAGYDIPSSEKETSLTESNFTALALSNSRDANAMMYGKKRTG